MGTYQGEKVERWKGEKIANALALLSHIVAAVSFHSFTFSPFYFYLGREGRLRREKVGYGRKKST